MDGSTRITNAPALITKIDRLRDELIKHFEALVGPANVERQSRSATAIGQYHMQVETAALIRAAEEFQSLIRDLQEMWLFGQLSGAGQADAQQQESAAQDAKAVGDLLTELLERDHHKGTRVVVNGTQDSMGEENTMQS